MARPFKTGLAYFPWDVDYKKDAKIRKLVYKYGPLGFYIYFDVVSMIYSEGYYLEMDVKSLAECVAMDIGNNFVKIEKVDEVILACADIGLFDKRLMLQGVVTCLTIQKQFLLSTRRRQKVNIDKYWLLDPQTMFELKVLFNTSEKGGSVDSNSVNVDNNPINVNNNTQKEKENKRDKYDIYDKGISAIPRMHFLTKCIMESEYINPYSLDYNKYNDLFRELTLTYGFEKVRAVTDYIVRYAKKATVEIDDRYDFFKSSAIKNLQMLEHRKEHQHVNWDEEIRRLVSNLDQ
jgi:hypothetical protein